MFSQNSEIILDSHWQFKQKGKKEWYNARVPGCVHLDLYTNKLIPDPFYSDSEKKLQWIENEDWEYKTSFDFQKLTFGQDAVELHFKGLDTYAKVYLNENLILTTNNAFRTWKADVKGIIRNGKNELRIEFSSAIKKAKALAESSQYKLPEGERIYARKPQFHFGWDFSPRFVTCGITRNISLITYSNARFSGIHFITQNISDSFALVKCKMDIDCTHPGDYTVSFSHQVKDKDVIRNKYHLSKGRNQAEFDLKISHPKLWWCNGMGDAHLYTAYLNLTCNFGSGDETLTSFGIRKIELKQEKDDMGSSFCFSLNGKNIFIKGANYIPPSIFTDKHSQQSVNRITDDAKAVHMNMLRVWGGGEYPDEHFYRQCDEKGIMVWQDLMFACAMYPGDSLFLENVRGEIFDNVSSFYSHPCIAMICGNNENDEGWKNWGWQKQFKWSTQDSAKIYTNYLKLFHETIPFEIKKLDSQLNYHPSSPKFGWGRKESLTQGDEHYWGVWWGKEPFEIYKSKTGRFVSEYGMQALPDIHTLKYFCGNDELKLEANALRSHQKHPTGFETIEHYMNMYYKKNDDLEKYIYLSQLLQRDALKTAIESHRLAQPKCMGTLFWQMNDCWPGISWSVSDYFHRPKAALYSVKELYSTLLPVMEDREPHYCFSVVNDSSARSELSIKIRINDTEGKTLLEKKLTAEVAANSIQKVYTLSHADLKDLDLSRIYCTFEIQSGRYNKKAYFYFKRSKELQLPKVTLEHEYLLAKNAILIKANAFAKDVCIHIDDEEIRLSDNFFDMEKGEKKLVYLTGKMKNWSSIKFVSLQDVLH